MDLKQVAVVAYLRLKALSASKGWTAEGKRRLFQDTPMAAGLLKIANQSLREKGKRK